MANRKRILFLCSWYPNKNAPTLGNFVQKHAESAALVNQISVIGVFSHNEKGYLLENKLENGVHTYIVYYPKVTFPFFIMKRLLQLYRTKKAFNLAYKEMVKNQGVPQLVHLNQVFPIGRFAVHLKKKFKIPFVVTENSTAYHMGSNRLPYLGLKHAISCMKKAERILPVSKDLQKSLTKLGVNVPMEIVPNVVNEHIFGDLQIEIPEKTSFLHVSTADDAHKNISGILRTIKKLSEITTNFHFRIISDGKIQPFIEMAYNQLNLSKDLITFEGTKTTSEIAEAMNESTAFVLFSNYENLPCVILESLTVGKPVITTNVNGIPECIDESNGILIEPRDEEKLLEAMLLFINKETCFDNAKIKQEALKKYSYRAVGEAFDHIYNDILK
ncbi:MAG: glycosyltransferase [Brumimicrobium sp.]|nr:glycosyltransferase [Brumimicrobium sp.]